MSTLADAMLAWKAKLTTKVTPEQVLTLRSDVNVFVDDVRFLESENAKLRELVRAAWRCIHTGASCSDCRLIAGGCTLQTAMRKLGVTA